MAIDDDYHSNSTTNLDKFHEKISSSNDYNEINDNDKVINNNSIMMKRILMMKQQQRINDKKPKDKTLKTSSTTTTTESKRMMENFLVNQRSDHHHYQNNNYFTFNCQYRTTISVVDNYHHLWQKIHYLNNDNDDDDKSKKISSTSTILTLTTKNSENSNFEQLTTIPMSIGDQIQYKCTMIVDHLEQCNQFYHHQRRRQQQQQSLIMFNRMMMMKSLNDSNGSLNLNQNQSSMNLPVHCHSIRIILKWPERIEQLSNNQGDDSFFLLVFSIFINFFLWFSWQNIDGQHSKFVVENVTKTTHITTNDDDDVEQINNSTIDDFNSYSFLNNHNNQSSEKQKSITNHYEAWINITNFTIDHQGIYHMLFYRKKLNNIDSKNNTGNFSVDDDDDDDGHEIIYEHSFRLIALSMY